MSIVKVKEAADKLADEQAARARAFVAPTLALTIKPHVRFFRRLAGLRGGDLDAKQDARYVDGKRAHKRAST